MTGSLSRFVKRLNLSLLILCFGSAVLFSQKHLSGNLNQPKAHVSSIPSNDRAIVDDVTGFNANDTVLLIQMQGVQISTGSIGYGQLLDFIGQPGQHEFLIIQSVNTGLRQIIFKNSILAGYDPRGNVQMVRVPYYNSAVVTGRLFCDPWDNNTKKGGVLALVIGRSLTLNADIDVSQSGFKGAKDAIGVGRCTSDAPTTFSQTYPLSFDNAGLKGEGIAVHDELVNLLDPTHMKGSGPNLNGGGGGNGRYSGGGGGSNKSPGGLGTGGLGGNENCATPFANGLGGFDTEPPSFPGLINRIYFGGGGGASTSPAGLTPAAGNGGGIVIIVSDTIIGNGGNILADGGNGGASTSAGGSGGGGGGGSIALSVNSYGTKPIIFSAKGGNGGDNPNSYGEGGGGGGGFVYVKNTVPAGSTMLNGGRSGNSLNPTASDGSDGELRENFDVVLNGFLFNSIRSDITGNQIDSICSNTPFSSITGTTPVGGVPGYDFVWQRSTTSEIAGFTPIPTATGKDYSPGILTQTTWFRRVITDHSASPIIDISKPVQIVVQNQITNNVITTNPDVICFHGDPQLIVQGTPPLTVPSPSTLKYSWQDSPDGNIWGSELYTEAQFDPAPKGVLTADRWYRRTVFSGRCVDNNAIVKITVLPQLTGNDFPGLNETADTICFGGNTNLNSITPPAGGNSADYRFKWESSTTDFTGPWIAAGSTAAVFDPDALGFLPVGNHFYRRIVFSGASDACKDTSNAAARKVWPVITNNQIKADQIVGYDNIPNRLTELSGPPLNGNGTYTYQWVKDTVNFPLAPVGANGINSNEYQPPKLTYTVSYIRKVNSSACTSNSNSVKITVDPKITNSISMANSAKDIIYTGQYSTKLIGSNPTGGSGVANDYAYRWYKSQTGGTSDSEWTPLTDSISLSPGKLTNPPGDTWFRRDVSSPKASPRATTKSNIIKITVLQKIVNAIDPQQSVCYAHNPKQLKSKPELSGGDGTYKFTWQDSTSGHTWANISGFVYGNSENYSPPALTSPAGYRRIVYSGKNDCGVETSNAIVIKINPVPAVPDPGTSLTIYSPTATYRMQAIKPPDGESGVWSVVPLDSDYPSPSISYPQLYNTDVSLLNPGYNKFKWRVNKGECADSAYVVINLMKNVPPNAFTPNNDAAGYNNTYVIEDLYPDLNTINLSIINSAGTEVFSITNSEDEDALTNWKGWDGKNSNGADLPEGTYYYLLKVAPKDPENGGSTTLKGFIVLKRY
jgi:gliding motility-associated-like protein